MNKEALCMQMDVYIGKFSDISEAKVLIINLKEVFMSEVEWRIDTDKEKNTDQNCRNIEDIFIKEKNMEKENSNEMMKVGMKDILKME